MTIRFQINKYYGRSIYSVGYRFIFKFRQPDQCLIQFHWWYKNCLNDESYFLNWISNFIGRDTKSKSSPRNANINLHSVVSKRTKQIISVEQLLHSFIQYSVLIRLKYLDHHQRHCARTERYWGFISSIVPELCCWPLLKFFRFNWVIFSA